VLKNGSEPLSSAIKKLNLPKFVEYKLNLKKIIESNHVLKNYGIGDSFLEKFIVDIIDLSNQGYEEDVLYCASILHKVSVKQVIENPSSILVLTRFLESH
jgi:hypothetical protein